MSVKMSALSLPPDVPLGVPKAQFATIKPVPVNATGIKSRSYTGQYDVASAKEEAQLRQVRDKFCDAFMKADRGQFPSADRIMVAKVIKAPDEIDARVAEQVWTARTDKERERVLNAAKGADEINAFYDQEKRRQAYLARKEEYRRKKAEKEAETKSKGHPEPKIITEKLLTATDFEKFAALQTPITLAFDTGESITGVMKNVRIFQKKDSDGSFSTRFCPITYPYEEPPIISIDGQKKNIISAKPTETSVPAKPKEVPAGAALPTQDTFNGFVKLQVPVTVTFENGKSLTGDLIHSKLLYVVNTEPSSYFPISYEKGFPQIRVNFKKLKVTSVVSASQKS